MSLACRESDGGSRVEKDGKKQKLRKAKAGKSKSREKKKQGKEKAGKRKSREKKTAPWKPRSRSQKH
jgi:hypothetical protein